MATIGDSWPSTHDRVLPGQTAFHAVPPPADGGTGRSRIPTTTARHGNQLATVNAKFDTGDPPTADQYEVVIVNR